MMPDPIDFFQAFLGVDIAKVEMITELVGAIEAALIKSMLKSDLNEELVRGVVRDMHAEFFKVVIETARSA